jgi:cytosol alanyl aminopeptidase
VRILSSGLGVAVIVACSAPVQAPPRPTLPPPREPPGGDAGAASAQARERIPLGPLPRDVRPVRETLALTIDPAVDRFAGTAELTLELTRPTERVWLHGRGLTVEATTVTPTGGAAVAARWDEVDPTGVVRVTLPRVMSGPVTLRVSFTAAFDPQLVGVYRVKTPMGPAVFSKFEAIYARRAFPCFDEPAFKVPFDVTLVVARDQMVIGNMPIVEEVALGPATKRVRFATTPPLPSYLVAFAVGPFERRATEVAPGPLRATPLPLGGVAIRGRVEHTAYALAEARVLVAELERYFGVAFPFPKLDLIAVPDFQSGAMENAGAITFRDSRLLVDAARPSIAQRIAVTGVVAHEIAHQWFGDLVTMPWWDDLWLNEGFATFLTTRTLRAVRPELEAELAAAADTDQVMNVDGLASARRIRQAIETTHDITNAFDGITYDKGAAVLAMLEHHIGDAAFRRGVHAFLVAHAGGAVTTGALIAALASAAGRPLGPLVASFLDQPGVPVVTAAPRCVAGRGSVELAQARWRSAGAPAQAEALWTIPVCVRAGIAGRVVQACTVLDAPTGALALPGCADWIMANADAAGYYRSILAAADLARLRDRGARQLAVVERLTLAHDLVAAFRSAALPGSEVLRALEPLARDPHGAVAAAPLELWQFVDMYVVDAARRATLRARLGALYAPLAAQLGWRPATGEPPWRRLLRTRLIGWFALQLEAPAALAEAARRGRRLLGLDRAR